MGNYNTYFSTLTPPQNPKDINVNVTKQSHPSSHLNLMQSFPKYVPQNPSVP